MRLSFFLDQRDRLLSNGQDSFGVISGVPLSACPPTPSWPATFPPIAHRFEARHTRGTNRAFLCIQTAAPQNFINFWLNFSHLGTEWVSKQHTLSAFDVNFHFRTEWIILFKMWFASCCWIYFLSLTMTTTSIVARRQRQNDKTRRSRRRYRRRRHKNKTQKCYLLFRAILLHYQFW